MLTYWEFGNIWYFTIIVIAIFTIILLFRYLRTKDEETKYKFLYKLTIINVIFHFLRLIFPPYVHDFRKYTNLRVLRVVGFENICAVNTLLGPFLYKSKNKYIKDYYMFVGFIGGLVAMIIPINPYTSRELFSFDMMRYFISHFILLIVPLFSYIFKLHTFNYRRFWCLPISFFACLTIIYLNENITYDLGWVEEKRNFSLIYGIPENLPSKFQPLAKFLTSIVPDNFKNYVGPDGNIVAFTPLLWMITPFIVIVLPLSFIFNVCLDFKNFKLDSINLYNKIKNKFQKA